MILTVGPTPTVQRRMTFTRIIPNQVNRALEVEQLTSGKGVNCARAVVRLGQPAGTLLFLGGESGIWMRQALEEEGIAATVVEVPRRTRTCSTILETDTGTATELVENAAPVDAAAVSAYIAAFCQILPNCRLVTFNGTIPPGAPATLYHDLVYLAQQHHLPTIVDAQGEALLAALAARPLIVKPNRSELAAATKRDCSTDAGLAEAIALLHQGGARWVLVSDGAAGAVLSYQHTLLRLRPPVIKPQNPIGSGDALTAGLAVSWLAGHPVPDAARFGIACGAANAAGPGYGRLDPALARQLLSQVQVEPLG
ncbi:MAG: hexose kinase [Deinococcus sp.]|nr:hexose kinase [Deinococcus sp.]